MSHNEQTYDLHPDWRLFLTRFALGIVLIPLLGFGIWLIWHYRKKLKGITYRISNSDITITDQHVQETIALADVTGCRVVWPRLLKRFGLGNIAIIHSGGTSGLLAISDPEPVASVIEDAAASERERMKIREEVERTKPTHPSGTLDKKNELVGLWQQGLISEEDFQQEIKKFEL